MDFSCPYFYPWTHPRFEDAGCYGCMFGITNIEGLYCELGELENMSEENILDESGLKRLIRVMNSVLNLYDIESVPEEIVDILYEPIGTLAEVLNLPYKVRIVINEDGEEEEEIDKFIMPEDFETWMETNGRNHTQRGTN